ncbi:S49 family peptidase [Marinomonas aquiplantarum]|uniref:Signal peptide peptidase SppA n=1 Tax=Marinomonas aquiplantarum TaxID=491951 RepID=A0A366CXR3_9GAMM|nr:S49 family peptidase [Marinomonas aquiplantarum]RBO82622.1 signal peptide peptidase SppA [Marinomonas aquiplantarum]
MRHLLQLMTNAPMMMTIDAHQANLSLLNQFYLNPELFFSNEQETHKDTFCHIGIFGPTSHRFNGLDAHCNQVLSYRSLRQSFNALVEDDSVKSIFVEFDGPGGEASGCFDLANLIKDISAIKPVIGFINGGSYSANYALASACTELYASPHSMAGSIGVIFGRREVHNDKETITYFTTGEAKADGSPHLALSDEERARHQTMVNQLGDAFFQLVAHNRGIEAAQVQALQAKSFTARDLLAHGLIDDIKTEEEIHAMMTDAKHKRIVAEIQATHEAETADMKEQIQALQTSLQSQESSHKELAQKINQLAQAAGVPEMAGQLIQDNASEEAAAKALKEAAAKKDEDISLTSGLESSKDEDYDMLQLIEEA